MISSFDKKDFIEINKKLKIKNLKEETINSINFAYDINEELPPVTQTDVNDKMYATVGQLNELRTELTARMDANQAETNSRIEKMESKIEKIEARMDKMEARMDKMEANQVETNAKMDKLFDIVFKLVDTINGNNDKSN
jgi:chromosome segregation ATPase